MYKILVTGDRDWIDYDFIYEVLLTEAVRVAVDKPTIIHGGAKGADSLAGAAAWDLGWPEAVLKANWARYEKAAGPIRNRWMLDLAPNVVFAFHDNLEMSKGTKDCVTEAEKRGIPVRYFRHNK